MSERFPYVICRGFLERTFCWLFVNRALRRLQNFLPLPTKCRSLAPSGMSTREVIYLDPGRAYHIRAEPRR